MTSLHPITYHAPLFSRSQTVWFGNGQSLVPLTLRLIEPRDNAATADVIRTVLSEFHMTGPGTSTADGSLNDLHATYNKSGAKMWVLEEDGGEHRIVGCGGFARLEGTSEADAVAEVQKCYFLPEARGRGYGSALMQNILSEMKQAGYTEAYLETEHTLVDSITLYRKFGFTDCEARGNTGHSCCDVFMRKAIT